MTRPVRGLARNAGGVPGESRLPRALLSDIGGVLVADQWARVAHHFAVGSPRREASLLRAFARASGQLDLGECDLQTFYVSVVQETGLTNSFESFRRQVLGPAIHPIDDNLRFYRSLKENTSLSLVAVTNLGPEISRALQRKVPLRSYFHRVIRSCDVGALKPDRAMFDAALEAVRAAPDEALFVDDLRANVAAARRLGIRSIWIPGPTQLIPALSPFLPQQDKSV